MDPALSNFRNNPKRQATNRKIGIFEAVGKGNPIVLVDVISASASTAQGSSWCGSGVLFGQMTLYVKSLVASGSGFGVQLAS